MTGTFLRSTALALVAGALAIAAPAPVKADEVKLGSVAGVTGPIAELLAEVVKGRNLAADQINAQGGMFGGDRLTMVLADSACDPKAAVDAGNKVVNVDQVVAIVGPNCSGATNGMVQAVSIPAGVVSISDSATAPSISELEDNDLVFRVAASDSYQGVALADLALAQGYEKIAVSYANDDYNAGLATAFAAAFEQKGGEVVAKQAHEPEKASYRAEAATLGATGADALALFAYYGSSGITIMRNMLELGLMDTFIGADGMVHEEVVTALGADNLRNARFTTAASDESTTAFETYKAAAEAAGVKPSAPYVAHGYDATFVLALAIEKAGSTDRAAVSAALREVANAPGEVIIPGEWEKAKALIAEGADINYVGATGEIEFDAAGDVAGLYSVNTVAEDGTWQTEILK